MAATYDGNGLDAQTRLRPVMFIWALLHWRKIDEIADKNLK
jgi:hypothetical protein